jgi:hypothetical protein
VTYFPKPGADPHVRRFPAERLDEILARADAKWCGPLDEARWAMVKQRAEARLAKSHAGVVGKIHEKRENK